MSATILLLTFLILLLLSHHAAYRNGVNDGYMAAKEWDNPGYATAVRILKKTGKWVSPEKLITQIIAYANGCACIHLVSESITQRLKARAVRPTRKARYRGET